MSFCTVARSPSHSDNDRSASLRLCKQSKKSLQRISSCLEIRADRKYLPYLRRYDLSSETLTPCCEMYPQVCPYPPGLQGRSLQGSQRSFPNLQNYRSVLPAHHLRLHQASNWEYSHQALAGWSRMDFPPPSWRRLAIDSHDTDELQSLESDDQENPHCCRYDLSGGFWAIADPSPASGADALDALSTSQASSVNNVLLMLS